MDPGGAGQHGAVCFTGALPQGADKDLQQLLRQADDSMYGIKKKMKERGT